MLVDRTNVQIPLGWSGRRGCSRRGPLAWRNNEFRGWVSGENSVENMGSIIGSVAHERSWRIVQLLQQRLDMRSIVDVLVGQIKNDDLVAAGVDADMELSPGSAFRSPVLFEQPFARSTKLQSRAVDDQMQIACSPARSAPDRQPAGPTAERRMIRNGKVDRLNSEVRIMGLTARRLARLRPPPRQCFISKPDGQASAIAERCIIVAPIGHPMALPRNVMTPLGRMFEGHDNTPG